MTIRPRTEQLLLATLALAAVAWRAAALLHPSDLVQVPEPLRLPLAGMGLGFLVCGLVPSLRRPAEGPRLLAVFALAGAFHWGGLPGAARPALAHGLLLAYLAVSACGGAALLHLALAFPRPWPARRRLAPLLYLPAAAGAGAALAAGALPDETLGLVASLLLLAETLLSFAGVAVFIGRALRADLDLRRRSGLMLVVAGVAVAAVPLLLAAAGALPGPDGVANLGYLALPVGLALALLRQERAAEGTPAQPHG